MQPTPPDVACRACEGERTFARTYVRYNRRGRGERNDRLELSADDVETIARIIGAVAHGTCRRWRLREDQHRDDMEQSCWAEVLRVKDRYDPRRASLVTFLWPSITRVCGRYAQKETRRNRAEFSIDERHHAPDPFAATEAAKLLEGVDVRVAAQAMGFSDAEIADMLGEAERDTTRLRRDAARQQQRTSAPRARQRGAQL